MVFVKLARKARTIPGDMAHAKRTGTETPASLQEKVKQLRGVARQLEEVARRLALRHGSTRRIAVLHSRGFPRVITKLKAFVADADKKASELG